MLNNFLAAVFDVMTLKVDCSFCQQTSKYEQTAKLIGKHQTKSCFCYTFVDHQLSSDCETSLQVNPEISSLPQATEILTWHKFRALKWFRAITCVWWTVLISPENRCMFRGCQFETFGCVGVNCWEQKLLVYHEPPDGIENEWAVFVPQIHRGLRFLLRRCTTQSGLK